MVYCTMVLQLVELLYRIFIKEYAQKDGICRIKTNTSNSLTMWVAKVNMFVVAVALQNRWLHHRDG